MPFSMTSKCLLCGAACDLPASASFSLCGRCDGPDVPALVVVAVQAAGMPGSRLADCVAAVEAAGRQRAVSSSMS